MRLIAIALAALLLILVFTRGGDEPERCEFANVVFEAYEYPAYEYLTFHEQTEGRWEEVDAWGTRSSIKFRYSNDDDRITFVSDRPSESNRRQYTLRRQGKKCVLSLDAPPFSWSRHQVWESTQ